MLDYCTFYAMRGADLPDADTVSRTLWRQCSVDLQPGCKSGNSVPVAFAHLGQQSSNIQWRPEWLRKLMSQNANKEAELSLLPIRELRRMMELGTSKCMASFEPRAVKWLTW